MSSSRKSNCVHFPAEESQVIGYGGDECYSDPEDDVSPMSLSIATPDDDDDEAWKVLQRLTQANTQFNAVTSNLSTETVDSVEAPAKQRTYTHLQLGRTPTDDRGNKRTLQACGYLRLVCGYNNLNLNILILIHSLIKNIEYIFFIRLI